MKLNGQQYEISAGEYRAVVTESGAGLRELTYDDAPLILSYDADELAPAAFGQLLIPWPNRIDRGRYEFDGKRYQLNINEPEFDCAIHGLVRWSSWDLVDQRPHRVRLSHRLLGEPGYPFCVELDVEYLLDDVAGLTISVNAVNHGSVPTPYGHGAHPYITVGEPIDRCEVTIPGNQYLPVNERMVPLGSAKSVEATEYDLRAGAVLQERQIDRAFTDLIRDDDDRAWVRLRGEQRATSFWLDATHPWLEVYTADGVPAAHRRQGLGVEPMTCPPNAFATGVDVIRLEPGQSHTGSWGVQFGA